MHKVTTACALQFRGFPRVTATLWEVTWDEETRKVVRSTIEDRRTYDYVMETESEYHRAINMREQEFPGAAMFAFNIVEDDGELVVHSE